MAPPILIIPGYCNSCPDHWQSRWQGALPEAARVELGCWEKPARAGWMAKLDAAICACATPPILVAHSLGVTTVAWWALQGTATIHAALLVAPPDLSIEGLPEPLRLFGTPPLGQLPFPAILVGSTNDPYCEISVARSFADAWGARFVDVGDAGHVNAASGYGEWPLGEELLATLI